MSSRQHDDPQGPAPREPREPDAQADLQSDLAAAGGIVVQCQFCVGRTFRRSRLRSADLPQIFLMRYPVRCRRCSQRQMVSFTVAGISVPSHVRHKQRRGSSRTDNQTSPS